MSTEIKPWYKSKTIMFNLIMSALVSAEQSFPLLQAFLGDSTYGILLFTLTIGNVVLRSITTSGVKL
jgi:hypothetical protein